MCELIKKKERKINQLTPLKHCVKMKKQKAIVNEIMGNLIEKHNQIM